jgi:hypothetical protein
MSAITMIMTVMVGLGSAQAQTDLQPYHPYVMMNNVVDAKLRQWSGTVIRADKEYFYVLSVNHATEDIVGKSLDTQVTIFPVRPTRLSNAALKATFIKGDQSRDLALYKFYRLPYVDIKLLEIDDNRLPKGSSVASYGFPGGPRLKLNKLTINSYGLHMYGNVPLLTCDGQAISGMSGGPLIKDDKIYGIQSSGSQKDVLFIPPSEIKKFLE